MNAASKSCLCGLLLITAISVLLCFTHMNLTNFATLQLSNISLPYQSVELNNSKIQLKDKQPRRRLRLPKERCPVEYFQNRIESNVGENDEDMMVLKNTSVQEKYWLKPSYKAWLDKHQNLSRLLELDIPESFDPQYMNPCWRSKPGDLLNCLPYYLMIGFPKCGTTDLYYKMISHPQVHRGTAKEPHWWTRTRLLKGASLAKYLSSFRHTASCSKTLADTLHSPKVKLVTGEASASTGWDNELWRKLPGNEGLNEPQILIAHHIHRYLPNTKLIAIVRDPTDRLFSDYLYFWKHTGLKPSGEDFHERVVSAIEQMNECLKNYTLRYCAYSIHINNMRLKIGLYSVFLRDWLTVFPQEQLHVIRTEKYSESALPELEKIYEFLELDPLPKNIAKDILATPKKNTRKKDKENITMLATTEKILREFYRPYNEDLASLLNDDGYLWA